MKTWPVGLLMTRATWCRWRCGERSRHRWRFAPRCRMSPPGHSRKHCPPIRDRCAKRSETPENRCSRWDNRREEGRRLPREIHPRAAWLIRSYSSPLADLTRPSEKNDEPKPGENAALFQAAGAQIPRFFGFAHLPCLSRFRKRKRSQFPIGALMFLQSGAILIDSDSCATDLHHGQTGDRSGQTLQPPTSQPWPVTSAT